jgi:hypothetical protein
VVLQGALLVSHLFVVLRQNPLQLLLLAARFILAEAQTSTIGIADTVAGRELVTTRLQLTTNIYCSVCFLATCCTSKRPIECIAYCHAG